MELIYEGNPKCERCKEAYCTTVSGIISEKSFWQCPNCGAEYKNELKIKEDKNFTLKAEGPWYTGESPETKLEIKEEDLELKISDNICETAFIVTPEYQKMDNATKLEMISYLIDWSSKELLNLGGKL